MKLILLVCCLRTLGECSVEELFSFPLPLLPYQRILDHRRPALKLMLHLVLCAIVSQLIAIVFP